ncbi:Ethanolamine-phosphate cytidylyltransferase [Nymphaea thermarum]|nr:Ethanolamine-phosphate cytidylyltransferase [Nymphaea thermarum]
MAVGILILYTLSLLQSSLPLCSLTSLPTGYTDMVSCIGSEKFMIGGEEEQSHRRPFSDAPYAITEEFMDKLFDEYRIDYIIHGDDPCLLLDGSDAYALAKKAGRYKQIKRTEGVSTTDMGPGPDACIVSIDGAFDLVHAGHVEVCTKRYPSGRPPGALGEHQRVSPAVADRDGRPTPAGNRQKLVREPPISAPFFFCWNGRLKRWGCHRWVAGDLGWVAAGRTGPSGDS